MNNTPSQFASSLTKNLKAYSVINSCLLLLVFTSLTTLSGCAFINEEIDLSYRQTLLSQPIPGSNKVSIHVEVHDQRPDTTKVGSKKNSYGVESAAITLAQPPALLVRRAIESELQARGFLLGGAEAQLKVTADLERFYNDIQTDYFGDALADFALTVAVKSSSGESLFSKHIIVQATEPNTQFFAADHARLALEQAERKGLQTLFQDREFIAALLAPSVRNSKPIYAQANKAIITASGELNRGR